MKLAAHLLLGEVADHHLEHAPAPLPQLAQHRLGGAARRLRALDDGVLGLADHHDVAPRGEVDQVRALDRLLDRLRAARCQMDDDRPTPNVSIILY